MAFERVGSLLTRAREPTDETEAAIVASQHPFEQSLIFVGLAHADQSPEPPATYALELPTLLPSPEVYLGATVLPAAPGASSRSCEHPTPEYDPRYAEWLVAQGEETAPHWPCDELHVYEPLHSDCARGRCLPFDPLARDGGGVSCRVTLELPDGQECLPEFGRLDPEGRNGERVPTFVDTAQGGYRICEIRQLEGAALESCRQNLECPDCVPGWCVTTIPELLDPCESPSFPNPFRFVGGSDLGPAYVTIACDKAE